MGHKEPKNERSGAMNQELDPMESSEEIDFSKARSLGRGVFHDRYLRSRGFRLLKPELARRFPDDESLNDALEEYLKGKHNSA